MGGRGGVGGGVGGGGGCGEWGVGGGVGGGGGGVVVVGGSILGVLAKPMFPVKKKNSSATRDSVQGNQIGDGLS